MIANSKSFYIHCMFHIFKEDLGEKLKMFISCMLVPYNRRQVPPHKLLVISFDNIRVARIVTSMSNNNEKIYPSIDVYVEDGMDCLHDCGNKEHTLTVIKLLSFTSSPTYPSPQILPYISCPTDLVIHILSYRSCHTHIGKCGL
jgi:hypothetical protein